MLKKITWVTLSLLMGTMSYADYYRGGRHYGCDIKREKLLIKLDYARAYGNYHQIQGIQRALQKMDYYCPSVNVSYPSSETFEYPEARDDYYDYALWKVEKKLRKAEYKLQEATMKGKPKEIAKRRYELERYGAEYDALQRMLDQRKEGSSE